MKLPLSLLLATIATYPTRSQSQTCPETYCAVNSPNTTAPLPPNSCPALTAVTLATFEYNGDTLIELLGPADINDAADLVITSPHGGSFTPAYIPARATTGPYCPKGCKILRDSYTKEIAQLVQEKTIENYCKVPFLVINHLHRSRLDANREVLEAAQEHPIAEDAWFAFHNFTNYAQLQLKDYFGTSTSNGVTGVNALLFDVHGYSGYDWVDSDGAPYIQWGYRFSESSLNPDTYCPLDSRSSGTIGTLTHARWIDGQSYECLVRGPESMGSRVASVIDSNGYLANSLALCGYGLPSFEFPSPYHLARDPNHCEDNFIDPTDDCHYYTGGYDVEVHERMDWENVSGDHFDTIQAEFPRCIRYGGSAVREETADALSVALMSFLRDLYGSMPNPIGSVQ